mmetsp:Transcript_3320/g.7373  ORF Transcript_3320/g.7373 Transcript_3320/m.7373 type:complete len:401 (-) Transcript_3320:62-1264(-)
MKLSLKTVTGVSFHLDLDESATIGETKGKIAEAQGANFPKERQVLIYKGQVLKDDTTLKDNSVTEDGFMVVTVLKGKAAPPAEKEEKKEEAPAPVPAAAAATPAAAAAAPKEEEAAKKPAEEEAAKDGATNMDTEGDAFYQSSASSLATGSELEQSVQMICDMGFEKEQVIKAMRAAYNNADRAVEYLMSGIPLPQTPPPQTAGGGPPAGAGASPTQAGSPGAAGDAPPAAGAGAAAPNTQPINMFAPGGGAAGAGGDSELNFLRTNPQFQALRQMVQANPQILQPMLQELGKQNPQLLQLINSNQGDFLRMLNEPGAEGGSPGAGAGDGGMGGMPPGMEEGMRHMQQNVVSVTPEEKESIDRLEAMGFDRALCIEAFFACDKNEALAANYLLEHAADFQ